MPQNEDVLRALRQLGRDMEARDAGLLQAFQILTASLTHMQGVIDEIHAAATKRLPESKVPALLEEIRALLAAQPAAIADAIREALDER